MRIEVVRIIVNYIRIFVLFILSYFRMIWKVNGIEEFVIIGKDFDKNIFY